MDRQTRTPPQEGHVRDKRRSRSPQNEDAVVWLLDHFVRERTKHYGDALALWHGWESEGFFDHLRAMLKTDIASPTELTQNDTSSKASKAAGKIRTRRLASSSRK
jgi:hypothetical protein